jgi:hypothetical protein
MVHQRQRLPLGLEAGDDLARVHSHLDQLERDRAPDRLLLLGAPHLPHPALPDDLDQMVPANPFGAGTLLCDHSGDPSQRRR